MLAEGKMAFIKCLTLKHQCGYGQGAKASTYSSQLCGWGIFHPLCRCRSRLLLSASQSALEPCVGGCSEPLEIPIIDNTAKPLWVDFEMPVRLDYQLRKDCHHLLTQRRTHPSLVFVDDLWYCQMVFQTTSTGSTFLFFYQYTALPKKESKEKT